MMSHFRLDHYRQNVLPTDEPHMNQLSPLEKGLLRSHQVVTVRGKRGRPVPILIPPDTFEELLNILGATEED